MTKSPPKDIPDQDHDVREGGGREGAVHAYVSHVGVNPTTRFRMYVHGLTVDIRQPGLRDACPRVNGQLMPTVSADRCV